MKRSELFTGQSLTIDQAIAAILEEDLVIKFTASDNKYPESGSYSFEVATANELNNLFIEIVSYKYYDITLSLKKIATMLNYNIDEAITLRGSTLVEAGCGHCSNCYELVDFKHSISIVSDKYYSSYNLPEFALILMNSGLKKTQLENCYEKRV